MDKILCIVGPTATGKTKLALDLARKWNGILINCDSIQVYKSLDIISGKDINVIKDVPIALIDVVPPTHGFNVSNFLNYALPIIRSVHKQGKLPILVGGTGFYLKALIDGIETLDIPPNQTLRTELKQKTAKELSCILQSENPNRFSTMNTSDRKNKYRLVRAIEVTRYLKDHQPTKTKIKKLKHADILIIGLSAPQEIIKHRIDKRVNDWIKKDALAEAKKLFKNYHDLSNQVKNAVGYKEMFEFLQGKASWDQTMEKLKLAEYHYVKKQMTWFKKDKRIRWFDVTSPEFRVKVERLVNNWLLD